VCRRWSAWQRNKLPEEDGYCRRATARLVGRERRTIIHPAALRTRPGQLREDRPAIGIRIKLDPDQSALRLLRPGPPLVPRRRRLTLREAAMCGPGTKTVVPQKAQPRSLAVVHTQSAAAMARILPLRSTARQSGPSPRPPQAAIKRRNEHPGPAATCGHNLSHWSGDAYTPSSCPNRFRDRRRFPSRHRRHHRSRRPTFPY